MNLFGRHPTEQDLALFAGGELGPISRWRIERHLESCAGCKTEAAEYFHLAEKLFELAEVPDLDWDAFAHNIQVASAQASSEQQPTRHTWIWTSAAALASVTCLVLLFGVSADKQPTASMETARARLESAAAPQAEESRAKSELGFTDVAEQANESVARENQPASASGDSDVARLAELGRSRAESAPVGRRADQAAVATLASNEWSPPDAQITAEGRLSFRSFDAGSGVMTITEYYAP